MGPPQRQWVGRVTLQGLCGRPETSGLPGLSSGVGARAPGSVGPGPYTLTSSSSSSASANAKELTCTVWGTAGSLLSLLGVPHCLSRLSQEPPGAWAGPAPSSRAVASSRAGPRSAPPCLPGVPPTSAETFGSSPPPTWALTPGATGSSPELTPLRQRPRAAGLVAGVGGQAGGAWPDAGVSAEGAPERLMTPSSSLSRDGPRSSSRRKDWSESERRSMGGSEDSRVWSWRGWREMVQKPESRP